MHDTLAISKYLSDVYADWRASEFAFASNVVPQQHWPIPFFGNPATAVVATVGVNPSSTEFRAESELERNQKSRRLEKPAKKVFQQLHASTQMV